MSREIIGPGEIMGAKRERYFGRDEVIKKIVLIAQADGITASDLRLETEFELITQVGFELIAQADRIKASNFKLEAGKDKYDSEGNLVYLSMQVSREHAREKGSGKIWYVYIVKGEHGPMGASSATCIIKASSTINNPNEVDFASVALEYDEKKDEWKK